MSAAACPPFWLETPRILIHQATEFFPFTEHDKRCTAAALNSFTRFGIYLGILLTVIRADLRWIFVGLAFAVFSVGAWIYMSGHGSVREGFTDKEVLQETAPITTGPDIVDTSQIQDAYVPDLMASSMRTAPTPANPFMNVLMTEYTDNPYRAPAANVQQPAARSELDTYFETMFASDPGDTFQRTQSQRQWVSMPSTTIPNDQDSFQNWLFRTAGRTCKEGEGSNCVVTMDGHIPWREMKPAA
jgi:hypothetical protein